MESEQNQFDRINESFLIDRAKVSGASMVTRHYHDAYEIYYLMEGERNYFIKNRIYSINKGALVFINMNDLHRTTNTDVINHERVLVNFKQEFISDILSNQKIDLLNCFRHCYNAIKLNVNEQEYVENLLHRMLYEDKKRSFGYDLYLKAMLIELLLFINRYIIQNPEDMFDHLNPLHRKVSDIVNYINSNYAEPLTLGILSSKFYMSPFYLSRIFKQATGFNFIEYLNTIRIMKSKRLLKESKSSITQIAEKVGFESTTHFGRVFKAITGQPPIRYRKNIP